MHIWYIHHYGGGPGVGNYDRPYQLARAWREQGHTATIFIAGFHHLMDPKAAIEPQFEVDGIRYVALPARRYGANGVTRMLNILDFSRNLTAVGRRYARDLPSPDAVIASSPHPFSIFAARSLAKRHDAKLVFEIRDIWPLSITEILGTSRWHPFVQMCAFAERFALTRSDLIASVLPRANRYLADRGFGHKPYVWVPNGFGPSQDDPVETEATKDTKAIISRWRGEERIIIVHAGSLGKHNAVDLLLSAAAHAAEKSEAEKIGIVLLGYGQQIVELKNFCKEHNLSNVHFSGMLPKSSIQDILRLTDIGYAGCRPIDSLYKYGVSLNKFADYYNASLPVFLPIAPCGDPVSESGAGIARRAETPEAVWDGLRDLVAMTPQDRAALGAKGKSYMAREYDYAGVAQRYAEAIERCPHKAG